MKIKLQRKCGTIKSNFLLPGDKSIAHRTLIIGALGRGYYRISNFPKSLDCLSTLYSMEKLGIKMEVNGTEIEVFSPGYMDFNKCPGMLNANNSGTTARLLSGLVSGCGIECFIDGDESLRKRPMDRIVNPLRSMGAEINGKDNLLPISFNKGNRLHGIEYKMPVDSAQVKSCVLIAGFLGSGETTVIENRSTRNHTEKMFEALGAEIKVEGSTIKIKNSDIQVSNMNIPGDISSAAFLIGCTLLSNAAEVQFSNILLNERRRKYLDILLRMGANIKYEINQNTNGEPTGSILVKSSSLNAVTIAEDEVPNIIDEIPLISVLAAFSSGKTVIKGIRELKFKESNRIKSIAENLILNDIRVFYSDDCMEIEGEDCFVRRDVFVSPHNDHRIAMAFAAFAARNLGETVIDNWECTNISFPNAIDYFKEIFDIHIHQ